VLPRPGCEEILEARSSVSELEGIREVLPAGGRAFVRGRMGRRAVRRDIWRVEEGMNSLVGSLETWWRDLGRGCVRVWWCGAWSEECGCAG
jgi:hypothetical protein